MMALGGAAGVFAPNLLTDPAFSQNAPRTPKGRVVVGLSQEPTVFNPLMAHIEVDDGVHFSVFDALFRIDPKGVIQPNLAAEVPTQKNGGISEDGLNWRIRLRDDVRWHDGKPFTAEDVKFTLELITKPNFRSWRTTGHSLVRDVTVVSPAEITWRMEEAFAPYLSFLTETFMALYQRRGFIPIGVIHQHHGIPSERHATHTLSKSHELAPRLTLRTA